MEKWAGALIGLLVGLFVIIIHRGTSIAENNNYRHSANMNQNTPKQPNLEPESKIKP